MKKSSKKKMMKRGLANTSRQRDSVTVPRVGPTDTTRMTVRASCRFTEAVTSGSIFSYAIGCNTPITPFKTAQTGEVPSYLTWMKTAYDRGYTVRSRLRVEFINGTIADSLMCVQSYDGDTSVSTSIDTLAESRHAQSAVIGYYSGGKNAVTMYADYSPFKFQGFAYNSPDNAFTSADPPQPYYWIVSFRSLTGGVGNMTVMMTVEYDIEFAELTVPPP